MASIIAGFEYDIFISYRQKDNKGDKWVSEFVEALKTELESTFKEEISVYFDINPHDGLLETHDVGSSLKEKLKCLVFIPIISRTYCDPKSFAWEHEFKAFLDLASHDQYGLMVKLQNGNIANRVLPVRIHDLDKNDIKLCESALGGILRGVEFIYKEPGVNRSLTPEDDEKINLNRTKYRNQLNKVALAVKDIIESIKAPFDLESPQEKETQIKESVNLNSSIPEIHPKEEIIKSKRKTKTNESKTIDSIVVIPFTNTGGDPDAEYLSDGITDSLMNRLAQLSKLRVIARTSAAHFKGENIDTERCRKELGVKAMVTGKVLRRGEQLSISANLTDIRNNCHLWGEKYNRNFSDIFIIEDEITRQIAEKLLLHLEPEDKRLLSRQSTLTPKAYELCLRSRSFRNQFTQKSIRIAIEYLEMALEEDPNYALAYGELASCYWGLGNLGHSPPREAYPKVQASAIKALQLDIDLAEAHLALGQVNTDYNWDWRAAEPEYKRAIQLRPSDSWLRMCYSWYLSIVQRNEESISEMRRALDLDPLSIMVSTCVGEVLMLARKSEQAIDQCQNVLAIDPAYWVTHYMLGLAYQQKGLLKDAVEALEKATLLAERDPVPLSMLGHAFGTIGRKEEARTILDELLVLRKKSYLSPFWISIVHLGLNETAEALNWLETGFAERAAYMNMILRYFHFDILNQDPRFKDLCQRINLIQCPA